MLKLNSERSVEFYESHLPQASTSQLHVISWNSCGPFLSFHDSSQISILASAGIDCTIIWIVYQLEISVSFSLVVASNEL